MTLRRITPHQHQPRRQAHFAARAISAAIVAAIVGLNAPVVVAAATSAVPGAWTAASKPLIARTDQTATRLDGQACAAQQACGEVLVAGGTVTGAADVVGTSRPTSTSELYHPDDRSWSPAAAMSSPRSDHTATLLHDGRVLVEGGSGGNPIVPLNSAELFDPSQSSRIDGTGSVGVWTSTGPMQTPRSGQTATLLQDGRVLVAGGRTLPDIGSATASSEIYDPAAGTWSSTPPMATARADHVATLLNDGRVLVLGGATASAAGTPTASVEAFDPVTNSWATLASMAIARVGHSAILLGDGRVLVAGGSNNPNGDSASAEIFNPSTSSWSAAQSMSTSRFGAAATLLTDDRVLVAGGRTTVLSDTPDSHGPQPVPAAASTSETFDPATGKWSHAGDMIVGRKSATATLLASGQVMLSGGTLPPGTSIEPSAEVFDPQAPATPPSITAIGPPTGSFLGGNTVRLVGAGFKDVSSVTFGGIAAAFKVIDVHHISATLPVQRPGDVDVVVRTSAGQSVPVQGSRFAFVDGAWSTGTIMARPTLNGSANTSSIPGALAPALLLARGNCGDNCNKVLVVGGGTKASMLYDPTQDHWDDSAQASETQITCTAGSCTNAGDTVDTHGKGATLTLLGDGRVLLAGGGVSTAEVLEPATGKWTTTASMSIARTGHTATLLPNGKVFVVGGGSATTETWDPVTNAWTTTAPMPSARPGHTATLLPNGKVLIAGGGTASAEIYDPASDSWTSAAPMSVGRSNHTATLLRDGTVLVTGGCCDGGYRLASAERYDPAHDAWTSAGAMSMPREQHSATLLVDGSVVVTGGCCDSEGATTGAADVYRPEPLGQLPAGWSRAPVMSQAVEGQATVLLASGRLMVAGGQLQTLGSVSDLRVPQFLTTLAATPPPSVEAVSPEVGPAAGGTQVTITGQDFVASPLSQVRFGTALATNVSFESTTKITAVTPPGAKGIVDVTVSNPIGVSDKSVGGKFTYAAGNWRDSGQLNDARQHHTATLLTGPACRGTSPPSYCDQVLVAGGIDKFSNGSNGVALASAEDYDPDTGLWSKTGSLADARLDHTATLLDGPACRGPNPPSYCGEVLVVGGRYRINKANTGGFTYKMLSSAELFNPATGKWAPTGGLATARMRHTATLLDGPDCEAATPPDWCGKVLVTGGTDGLNGRALASSELYDPASGTWSATGSLDTECAATCGRYQHTATALPDGRVLAVGGYGPDPNVEPYAGYAVSETAQVGSMISNGVSHPVLGTVDPDIRLRLSVSANHPANSSVAPGDVVTYTWQYANTGDVPLDTTIAPVALPLELDFVSASTDGAWDATQRQVTFPDVVVAPHTAVESPAGSFSVTARVRDTFAATQPPDPPVKLVPDGDTISLNATISAEGVVHNASAVLPLWVARPDDVRLAVSSTPSSGSPVQPGDLITYRLAWFNLGTAPSEPLVISDSLPIGLDLVSLSDGGAYQGDSDRGVTFPAVVVPPATTAADPAGTFTITARVRDRTLGISDGPANFKPPPIPAGTNFADAPRIGGIQVGGVQHTMWRPGAPARQPLVAVTADVAGGVPVAPGARITYQIAYFNPGTTAATGIVIKDNTPLRARIVSASPGASYVDGTTLVTFPAVDIPPGTTADSPAGTFAVTVDLGAGDLNNWSLFGRPISLDDSASFVGPAGTTVKSNVFSNPLTLPVGVLISSDPQPGVRLVPGNRITYTISWFNRGNVALENLPLTMPLYQRLDFVSGTNGAAFDPATNTVVFSPVEAAPRTTADHPSGTVTVTLVVAYGVTASLSTADIYDPTTGHWSAAPASMSTGRQGQTATLLPDSTVLVAGGFTSTGTLTPVDGAEVYDAANGTWSQTHLPSEARGGHTATELMDGTVLVVGGAPMDSEVSQDLRSSVEVYEPADKSWSLGMPLDTPIGANTATLLDSPRCHPGADAPAPPAWCGSVLIAGGQIPFNTPAAGQPAQPESTNRSILYTPAPTLKALDPVAGAETGGNRITLTGSGFAGANVTFGETPATDVQVVSPDEITATAPPHAAGRVEVKVGNAGGLSATLPADPAHLYTYGGPARVSDLAASASGDAAVQLTFTAPGSAGSSPPPAGRYDVKQSLAPIDGGNFGDAFSLCDPECDFSPANVGDALSLRVTDLDPSTTYYYALRAVNDEGLAGPISNEASALTGAGPPVGPLPDEPVVSGDQEAPAAPSATAPANIAIPLSSPLRLTAPVAQGATPNAAASKPLGKPFVPGPPAQAAKGIAHAGGDWTPGPAWWIGGALLLGALGLFGHRRYFGPSSKPAPRR